MTDQEILEAQNLIASMRDDLSFIAVSIDEEKLTVALERVRGNIEPLLRCFTPLDGRYVPQGHYFDMLIDGLSPIIAVAEGRSPLPLVAVVANHLPFAIGALDKIAESLTK